MATAALYGAQGHRDLHHSSNSPRGAVKDPGRSSVRACAVHPPFNADPYPFPGQWEDRGGGGSRRGSSSSFTPDVAEPFSLFQQHQQLLAAQVEMDFTGTAAAAAAAAAGRRRPPAASGSAPARSGTGSVSGPAPLPPTAASYPAHTAAMSSWWSRAEHTVESLYQEVLARCDKGACGEQEGRTGHTVIIITINTPKESHAHDDTW